MKGNRLFVASACAIILIFCVLIYANHQGWFEQPPQQVHLESGNANNNNPDNDDRASQVADNSVPPHEGWKKVGGVWRPPSDTQATNKPDGQPERNQAPLPNPGMSQPIAKDTTEQTQSIAESLETRENIARVSPFLANEKFDRQKYLDDPQAYLNEHNSRRAFEPAEQAEDVRPIKRLSPYYQKIIQGETVVLRAQGEPNMPVSFYAPNLGVFEESQTSAVSVQADESGIAETRYRPTEGTHGDTVIVAASPVNTKQTKFIVHVVLPKQSDESASGN